MMKKTKEEKIDLTNEKSVSRHINTNMTIKCKPQAVIYVVLINKNAAKHRFISQETVRHLMLV